jgi:hypothetical protein
MKLFKACEPRKLKIDLQALIRKHVQDEGIRRIYAEERLQTLQAQLNEVTVFIASQGETT